MPSKAAQCQFRLGNIPNILKSAHNGVVCRFFLSEKAENSPKYSAKRSTLKTAGEEHCLTTGYVVRHPCTDYKTPWLSSSDLTVSLNLIFQSKTHYLGQEGQAMLTNSWRQECRKQLPITCVLPQPSLRRCDIPIPSPHAENMLRNPLACSNPRWIQSERLIAHPLACCTHMVE